MNDRQEKQIRYSPQAETALLGRVADRDRHALAELYRLYHPRLFQFAYRLTGSYGAAEELVNDTMLAVWTSAQTFRKQSKVSTWIFGIAYRKCMSRLRRNRLPTDSAVSVEHLPDRSANTVEERDWVREGLNRLSEEQRLCVILVFYVGCSYAEVAEIAACKAETVKTRMFHARRKLRLAMPDILGLDAGRVVK